jgi:hypothetical protein
LIVFAVIGLYLGGSVAYYPGPRVTRSSDSGAGIVIGPDGTYPLGVASLGFLGFASACVVACAWLQVAALKYGQQRKPVEENDSGENWEIVGN